jgi:hypothetical protein
MLPPPAPGCALRHSYRLHRASLGWWPLWRAEQLLHVVWPPWPVPPGAIWWWCIRWWGPTLQARSGRRGCRAPPGKPRTVRCSRRPATLQAGPVGPMLPLRRGQQPTVAQGTKGKACALQRLWHQVPTHTHPGQNHGVSCVVKHNQLVHLLAIGCYGAPSLFCLTAQIPHWNPAAVPTSTNLCVIRAPPLTSVCSQRSGALQSVVARSLKVQAQLTRAAHLPSVPAVVLRASALRCVGMPSLRVSFITVGRQHMMCASMGNCCMLCCSTT